MKKQQAIAFIVGVLVLAIIGFKAFRSTQPILPPLSEETNTQVTTGTKSLIETLGAPIHLNKPFPTQVPTDCREFWKHTVESRFADQIKEINEMGWHRPQSCDSNEKFMTREEIASLNLMCANKLEIKNCEKRFAGYRARLIHSLSAGQTNFLDMPLPQLTNKMFADTFKGPTRAPFTETAAMLDAIESRERDWFAGQKLVVAVLLARSEDHEQDQAQAEQIAERFERELSRATELDGQDQDILRVELYRQFQRGEDGWTELERFAQKHPRSAEAQYYWAAAQCKGNQQEGCFKALEKAIAADPQTKLYQDTLASARQKENVSEDGLFTISASLDVLTF